MEDREVLDRPSVASGSRTKPRSDGLQAGVNAASSVHEPSADVRGVPPLVFVDLDQTLVQSDLLFEAVAAMIRSAPLRLLLLPVWLLKGRAYLKARLAADYPPDADLLPYRTDVLEYLTAERAKGASLVLATASSMSAATRVAEHLGIFDATLASDDSTNLKGERKAQSILAHAAGRPFTYIGDEEADLMVWKHAPAGLLVGVGDRVSEEARKLTNVVGVFPSGRSLVAYLRVIRVHQWVKNFLIFVPLVVSEMWKDSSAIASALLAFLAFCACASATYLWNDLCDLGSDRRHPHKRYRPLASGEVPIKHAMLAVLPLATTSLLLATQLGMDFAASVGVYAVATLAYSMHFKSYVLVDVFMLAGLYTSRIVAGAMAIAVPLSFWLLAFSMFLFLSLAVIKRCSELQVMQKAMRSGAHGRDYQVADYAVLQSIGVASGIASVVVFALYIDTPYVADAYQRPQVLWVTCATLAYWISRMWIKTARGEMHDDPIIYAAKDRGSRVMLAVTIVTFVVAQL